MMNHRNDMSCNARSGAGNLMRAGVFCAIVLSSFVARAGAEESYRVDPAHSVVIFRVSHVGAGVVYGRFRSMEGTFTKGGKASAQNVQITIDASSIYTADKKRDTHLSGPDFLNVKQFPKITFASKRVRRAGSFYVVKGDLTLHGVTKTVSVRMKNLGSGVGPMGMYRTGFEGKLSIKRGDYGIAKMPGAVGKEIQLIIAVEGVRKKAAGQKK